MAKNEKIDLSLDNLIHRRFTKDLKDGQSVYDMFEWASRDVVLKDYKTGTILTEMYDVEFPIEYSQNAIDIIVSKYFRKAGVPETGHEKSMRQVAHRLVSFWVEALKDEKLISEEQGRIVYDELVYALLAQYFAPNSPQWFNTGIKLAYGIEGKPNGTYYYDPVKREVVDSIDTYSRTQASACFIVSIDDSLIGPHSITEQYLTETTLFKGGSGTGTNFSTLRAAGEKLSSGGTSSGVMSFLKGFDANAGVIKSGGTCLAPWTLVKTEKGNIKVQELAEKGEEFITLSYNPIIKRVQANRAIAFESGEKELYKLTTDKGIFTMSLDHPVMLMGGGYKEVRDLTPGMSLMPATITIDESGHEIIGLHDGKKGKEKIHRLIAQDVMGVDLSDGAVVHHVDGNPTNNAIENLEVLANQAEHARIHGKEKMEDGTHPFLQYHGKKRPDISGDKNGMSWASGNRTKEQDEKRIATMHERDVFRRGQKGAAKKKMLNTAYKVLNLGGNIDTFEDYYKTRTKLIGKIASKKGLLEKIVNQFGSYENFVKEVRDNNHKVLKVESLGYISKVYDVMVYNDTPEDKTEMDGHNFPIITEEIVDERKGQTGIFVHNTRRSAKMVVLDVDHPEIMEFIKWKSKEEQKVRDLIKMGYDSSFDGEAYATVSGQNSNNSIMVSDEFMKKVAELDKNLDATIKLKGRVDHDVDREIKVSEIWDAIAQSSWLCADPALQYGDTFNKWHTCPAGEDGKIGARHNKINSTNP